MELKKEFISAQLVDFSKIKFYQIPYPFFAQWLNLVLEISKVIQPGFQVDIPKKALDWYNFPDRVVFEHESGATHTLRTSSVLLKNNENTIHVLAQCGYEIIPGQYILIKSNPEHGSIISRSDMNNMKIRFDIRMEEKHLQAVEEIFYVFQ